MCSKERKAIREGFSKNGKVIPSCKERQTRSRDLPLGHEKGCKRKMAALATPNKNSYVVKKDCAAKIIESKKTIARTDSIKQNANLFSRHNLNNGRN